MNFLDDFEDDDDCPPVPNHLSVGDVVYIKDKPGKRYAIKDKRQNVFQYIYSLEINGNKEWFTDEDLVKCLEQNLCEHPKGSVYINSANGNNFRFCKKCKTDLGDA